MERIILSSMDNTVYVMYLYVERPDFPCAYSAIRRRWYRFAVEAINE
jgi:hypothetical protein